MPVPATIDDLSTTAGSNSPAGGETPKDGDNYIRSLSSFVALLRDKLNGTSSATLSGATLSGSLTLTATNLTSGTYTPTLSNTTNIASSTARQCQWLRVGNVVTVSGTVTVQTTAGTGASLLGISLPVASAFTTAYQLSGTAAGYSGSAGLDIPQIIADATNDRASMKWVCSAIVTPFDYAFTFSYEVI